MTDDKPIMATKPKPNGKCYDCSGTEWWWRPSGNGGDWLCSKCITNPNPESYVEPDWPGKGLKTENSTSQAQEPANGANEGATVDFSPTPENLALLKRVRDGNTKLCKVWPQIIKNPSDEEFAKLLVDFYNAKDKLQQLSLDLEAKGYHDCLYIENGVKTIKCGGFPDSQMCKVCPSQIDYLEQELFGGPPTRRHFSPQLADQGKEVMTFLKTLGGQI